MNIREFLQMVITAPEGSFCLALGPTSNYGWREYWFHWPEDLDKIVEAATAAAPDHNVYFSTYLSDSGSSLKTHVLPSRTIQADLDNADIYQIPIPPTILIQTSPGRHQGYWLLSEALSPEAHEILSRKITYSIPGCDRSGWPIGRKVRVLGTLNHKYSEGPHEIVFQGNGSSLRTYTPEEIELLEDSTGDSINPDDDDRFLQSPPQDIGTPPREFFSSVRDRLPATVRNQYDTRVSDRSKALWSLACAGFRAGLDRDQVFFLCKNSANNKFEDLRMHSDRELAKDVLRAELVVRSRIPNPRAQVLEARLAQGPSLLKHQQLASIIQGHMKQVGTFIKTEDDRVWYIRTDIGRPIMISHHSEQLDVLLDYMFDLNSSDGDQRFITHNLTAFAQGLPTNGRIGSLSYYDPETNSMFLHTGHRDIIHITTSSINRLSNGAYGIIFPWINDGRPFTPTIDRARFNGFAHGHHWSDILFDGFLGNIVNMSQEESKALLKVWLLFILFRADAESRPLLALFGQPGGGKTTLAKCFYELLFGMHALEAITDEDDYDQAMISRPLAIYDGVDSWEKWFPDRFSQSTTNTKVRRRKLYTDADEFFATRQAIVGVTAHNPHFGREDIFDRMLVFLFERFSKHSSETEIINKIATLRNLLWAGIVDDIQIILRTPRPTIEETPEFRIADFGYIGRWIARGLGCEDAFVAGLPNMVTEQKVFTIEDDHLLVTAMKSWMRRLQEVGFSAQDDAGPDAWKTPSQLWSILEAHSGDETMAFGKRYKNAVVLGKKLWVMHDVLKALFTIETKFDASRGSRIWKIRPKEGVSTNG